MKRDLNQLSENKFDILVIGGGVYGAFVAWDAALRGLSVALVEKADFASATSANSLKIIHGGFRYLQHADFRRMRESTAERTNLMRIAPHLVHPLPVVIPAYGHWTQRKEVINAALTVNQVMGMGVKSLDDPQKQLSRGHVVSRDEVIEALPYVEQQGLMHGMLFYDAQVYNSERFVMSILHSAANSGAVIANYSEVVGLLQNENKVIGVEVRDVLTDEIYEVQGKAVVNAAGPWAGELLQRLGVSSPVTDITFAKSINIVTKALSEVHAFGIASKREFGDSDVKVDKGNRLLFAAPWRGKSIIGTTYDAYDGNAEDFRTSEEDVVNLLDEVNYALPSAHLTFDDVDVVHGGLLPSYGVHPVSGNIQLTKHHWIRSHSLEGLDGLFSIMGVKFTTARNVAEETVDKIFASWGKAVPKSRSSSVPIYGGEIARFEDFLTSSVNVKPCGLDETLVKPLILNYGSEYTQVLQYMDIDPENSSTSNDELAVLRAETMHAVHSEMACKLGDVVFRRTELGTIGRPGSDSLMACAEVMEKELGWSPEKTASEIRDVEEKFSFSKVAI